MTVIQLDTRIYASIERCFDIMRDVDIHMISTEETNERAVAGRTSGLCELGDTITWQAKHFYITQNLTVKITGFNRPVYFEDTMIKGAFKSMRHEHLFIKSDGFTIMKDRFIYKVPFGIIGDLFDKIILKKYMTSFLTKRNSIIKSIAERNT